MDNENQSLPSKSGNMSFLDELSSNARTDNLVEDLKRRIAEERRLFRESFIGEAADIVKRIKETSKECVAKGQYTTNEGVRVIKSSLAFDCMPRKRAINAELWGELYKANLTSLLDDGRNVVLSFIKGSDFRVGFRGRFGREKYTTAKSCLRIEVVKKKIIKGRIFKREREISGSVVYLDFADRQLLNEFIKKVIGLAAEDKIKITACYLQFNYLIRQEFSDYDFESENYYYNYYGRSAKILMDNSLSESLRIYELNYDTTRDFNAGIENPNLFFEYTIEF